MMRFDEAGIFERLHRNCFRCANGEIVKIACGAFAFPLVIAELERLLGQKTGELDFFAAALRNVEEVRPSKSSSSGGKTIRRSRRLRKAEQRSRFRACAN
jgi:hypothetical protein